MSDRITKRPVVVRTRSVMLLPTIFAMISLAFSSESPSPITIRPQYPDAPGTRLVDIEAVVYSSGERLNWHSFEGKVLIVQTFASWCRPCKEALPHYYNVSRILRSRGVEFVALSFDSDPQKYQAWVKNNYASYECTFAHATVNDRNWREKLWSFNGGLPGFYVVGRNGLIVVGYRTFSAKQRLTPLGYDQRLVTALAAAGVELSRAELEQITINAATGEKSDLMR